MNMDCSSYYVRKGMSGETYLSCYCFQLVCCNDWGADKQAISEKKNINATDWAALEERNQSVNISVLMQRKETENTGYSEKC